MNLKNTRECDKSKNNVIRVKIPKATNTYSEYVILIAFTR